MDDGPAGISAKDAGRADGVERAALARVVDRAGDGGEVFVASCSLLVGSGIERAGGRSGGAGGASAVISGATGNWHQSNRLADRGGDFAMEPVCGVRAARRGVGPEALHEHDGLRPFDPDGVCGCGGADGSASGESAVLDRVGRGGSCRADALLLLLVRGLRDGGEAGRDIGTTGDGCELCVGRVRAGGGDCAVLPVLFEGRQTARPPSRLDCWR